MKLFLYAPPVNGTTGLVVMLVVLPAVLVATEIVALLTGQLGVITATEDREEDVAGALVVATFVVDGAGALLDSFVVFVAPGGVL